MTQCPNCKQKLRLTDVSQNCPHCGVNMRFFGYDERFYHDAKEAELSNARVHVFVRTMKAALIGSRFAVIRLVASFLPAAALIAPIASAQINFPFMSSKADLGILGVVAAFQAGIINCYPALLSSVAERALVTSFTAAAVCFAVAALCGIGILLTTLLNFFSVKRAAKANCVFALLGTSAIVACAVLSAITASRTFDGSLIGCSLSFGWTLQLPVYLALFAINLTVLKNGIPVELDEGMAERVEIAKKIRRGGVKLEDLPQPVVETAATRKIAEEIEKAREEYREKIHQKETAEHA